MDNKNVIDEFAEIEKQIEEQRKYIIPIPVKRNTIFHLLERGYQVTLSPNLDELKVINEYRVKNGLEEHKPKHPIGKDGVKWQKQRINQDNLSEFLQKCEDSHWNKFYGVLTSALDANNVTVFDFDIKRLPKEEQETVIELIERVIQTEYIQTLIQSKKIYIETTLSNGYHFICSVNDSEERKSNKLLQLKDYECIAETIGKNHHCVIYPSNGYRKLHNILWEIEKISSKEYEDLFKFIVDFFTSNPDIKDVSKEHHLLDNKSKKRIPKNERGITTETNIVIRELKKYQKTFANTQKDITILSELLQKNGYTLISETPEYLYYIHPNSSKAETNFSLSKLNHCVTNFSGNNQDFPTNKSVGTLTAFHILNESKHNVNEIIELLRQDYNVKLVRTYEEIINDLNNK